MKYVLVTGGNTQMEVISEDGTSVTCQSFKNNYPENVSGASAAVTDGTNIVACGANYDGK